MKAPRIVQSYWSKAYQNTPNSGWAFRESHYMSWALSCLQLKQFYDEIELVTDRNSLDGRSMMRSPCSVGNANSSLHAMVNALKTVFS